MLASHFQALGKPALYGAVITSFAAGGLAGAVLYGFVGQIDGLVRRIVAELGGSPTVVATGGLAPIVIAESETIDVHEPNLTLYGLRLVYDRNIS